VTVQQTIEKSLSTLLRNEISILGCGRTDTGVHAKKYVFHFDTTDDLPKDFEYHLNAILPVDIAVYKVAQVPEDFHARFSAQSRRYEYHIHGFKSPFIDQLSYRYKFFDQLDLIKLQSAADVLKGHHSFFPFCISKSGTGNYEVDMHECKWTIPREGHLLFTISANRFLRGMVRLITGMCLNSAIGQITLHDVKASLDSQTLLPKSLSIPSHGLYLAEVNYPPTMLQAFEWDDPPVLFRPG
jgi:tRNA pseudouridine38-40 synthase